MAKIDQRLLQAIADKQGITVNGAYRQVTKAFHETFLERDLAALVVASRLKININKFSTPAQRQQIRSHLSGVGGKPAAPPPAPAPPATRGRGGKAAKPRPKDNSVFVIGGRDTAVTESMYALLNALGCKPVEFHQAVARVRGTGSPYVGVVLDKAFEQVQALVVLFTPDDEAKLKDQFLKPNEIQTEGRYRGQARQNVVFEAGMALARHEDKTILVQIGEVKSFSDVFGRHLVNLDGSHRTRIDFANRLKRICKIDTTGTRWLTVGKFEPSGPAPTVRFVATPRKKKRR